MTNETEYMIDAKGNQISIKNIKPVDIERDALVKKLIDEGKQLSKTLGEYKANAFAQIQSLIDLSAEQYNAVVGGKKGNVTLYSFDGKFKLQRSVAEHIAFDERLQAAKALIDECLKDWSKGANQNLCVIIERAFQVDKEGKINTGQVLALRRHEINDERWKRAMDAISDSLQVVGSKSYVRLYERVGDTDQYIPIPLDIAAI